MDKNLRVQVLETYNRYVNAIVEADMETINKCVAVSEKKAYILMRNCRRLRDDGTIIEEATGFTLLEIQKKVGRFMLSQILPSPLKKKCVFRCSKRLGYRNI